jgi:two-component system chemotaxis sensor kinase CheA
MIDEIRKIFLSEAQGQLELIESISRGEFIEGEESAVNAVYRAMHSMKGSAPMFGYEHVSDITNAVEQTYKRFINSQTMIIPDPVRTQTGQAALIIRKCLSSLEKPDDEVLLKKKELVDYFNQLQ